MREVHLRGSHSSTCLSPVCVFLSALAASSRLPPSLELHPPPIRAGAERRRTGGADWSSCPPLSSSWAEPGAQSSRSERSSSCPQQVCPTCPPTSPPVLNVHQHRSHQTCLHVHVSPRSCGHRLAVFGRVSSVCSVLLVRGTSFFFFSLTDHTHSLPVLVKVGHSPLRDVRDSAAERTS